MCACCHLGFSSDSPIPKGCGADEALVKAAKRADKLIITEVSVFDLYEGPHVGEDKKSLAIQVTLQPQEKTFTDAEIEALAAKVVDAVTKATGGTLRG